jgi:hypothetical protein
MPFLSRPNCASPELRLARIAPREYASFSLRSRGLLENTYDQYNVIRLIMSFLSRSTKESGFQTKKTKKRPERKIVKKSEVKSRKMHSEPD